MRHEVKKLLDSRFITEVRFLKWLANMVMVSKSPIKWRMCGDHTYLNKTCLKDPYPPPDLNKTVDVIADHELLSFMDMFSVYNQIKIY